MPDSLVIGYEGLIDSLTLKDPDDRHVLVAAIRCHADVIITFNQKDFDEDELSKYDIHTEHPDEFISNMINIATPRVLDAVRKQRARLKNPPKSVEEFLSTLHDQGLPQTVNALSEYAGSL